MASIQISRAESWEKIHEAFSQVNFNAFDYATVKESLIDYLKLYHSETFNDMIESSEFIAILELFCYVAELAAYRLDMNAHENFMSTAKRKESILRLAKFISYKPSRNIPARGLVKIVSVSTTETVFDSIGRNLANVRINWNDPNNPDWKEHFLLVINKVLEQNFGTVTPNERKQFENVLFELYSLNNNPIANKTVFSYTATSGTQTIPMELVPVNLTDNGPQEKRPENNAKLTILYGNDGLGDASDLTGFFFFTKQGTLQRVQTTFDGITPNPTYEILVNNINETDVWINNVDPNTREILINDPYTNILPHLVDEDTRYGEWFEVDISNAQNIIFNTNRNRRKYEIETLDNDRVKIIFGDGEFADIPNGSFDIWYRTSLNEDTFIPRSSVIDSRASFTYTDSSSYVQTFNFSFSLVSTLQNGSKSEDIEHIRKVAPSVYYTQDRMVNGRDYNTFMLKDPSIMKLKAINRTFAGDSKYIAWHDPKEYYENVKIFGDDLALYWEEKEPQQGNLINVDQPYNGETVTTNFIEPILSGTDFFAIVATQLNNYISTPIRKYFTNIEADSISLLLNQEQTEGTILYLWYDVQTDVFSITLTDTPVDSEILIMTIQSVLDPIDPIGWDIRYRTKRLVAHSEKTKFWNTNSTSSVINYDTLKTIKDNITVLKANVNGSENALLSANYIHPVVGQCLLDHPLSDIGLPDNNRLSVVPTDLSDDGISDNLSQPELMTYILDVTPLLTSLSPFEDAGEVVITLPKTFVSTYMDSEVVVYLNGSTTPADIIEFMPAIGTLNDKIKLVGIDLSDVSTFINNTTIHIKNFVYMQRESTDSMWYPIENNDTNRLLFANDESNEFYTRFEGRYPLNFAWFHYVQQYNLVDPAASNIIDMFILTKGYYLSYYQWVTGKTTTIPVKPSSLSLRSSYAELLDNSMISDTVILHSADFRVIFGPKAPAELRCKFNVIRPSHTNLTDNELKVRIVDIVRNYFNVDNWDFGQTFYFTQLAATIQTQLSTEIDSIVIVPLSSQRSFGDMFQISAKENELLIPDITTNDIEIVQSFTQENLRQNS